MRYGAIEQFSEVLAGPPEKSSCRRSRQFADVETHVAQGWFLFFLLAAVIYSAIWCVQLAITIKTQAASVPYLAFVSYDTYASSSLPVLASDLALAANGPPLANYSHAPGT